MNNKKVIDKLNNVVVKNFDASRGYQKAADNVESPALKRFFSESSLQRSTFAGDLQQDIRTMGQGPTSETSMLSAAHRTWIDLKSAISDNNNKVVIDEVIKGEKNAISEYEGLLDQREIPLNIRDTLESQKNEINQTLQQIEDLRQVV